MIRYYLLCVASAGVWAVISYYIGEYWMSPQIWGGIAVSPLIGLVAGAVYRPAYRFPFSGRVAMSLFTFYLSVALFGIACGIFDALRELPDGSQRNTIPVIFQGLAGTFYGVTATGFVGFLWPLAHLNHWFVGRVARCHLQPLQGPDHPGR
ncbi:MAG TPA: hypothetical protein EYN79_10590 [Planctomycetes bacterium]|nr:hypothetical protein [Planctomycetota bacterium]HIN79531.1 hypothetical protein [Planctomycetota bacterium]